jgi:hypothetical protein
MKKLILNVKDFLQFRQVAEMYRIKFDYWYLKGGTVTVKADKLRLNEIGY